MAPASAVRAIPAQPIHQQGHREAAEEGKHGQHIGLPDLRQRGYEGAADDRGSRTERGAAGHPDEPGIGQGVAKESLHRHAAQGQHGTRGAAEQRTRQSDLAQDQLCLLQTIMSDRQSQQAQRRQRGVVQRQAQRAQRQRQPDGCQQQHAEYDKQNTYGNPSAHQGCFARRMRGEG